MFSLFCFLLAILASPFKSKSRLEAENDRDGAYGSEKVMSWHSVQESGTVECVSLRKLRYVRRRSRVRSANALVSRSDCVGRLSWRPHCFWQSRGKRRAVMVEGIICFIHKMRLVG